MDSFTGLGVHATGHFRRVSDLLRSARLGSDVSNHSGSFTSSINDSAMRPNSASYSPASHKGSDFLPNSIQPRYGSIGSQASSFS